MTLVEVIVAMVIIAIVSVMAVSAFTFASRAQIRNTESKNNAATAEQKITAEEITPSETQDVTLNMGGFTIPVEANTYTEGARSYTVLELEGEDE
jgi:prepilin-type N-terminal cleavage/methylation domain-containing protein